MPGILFFWFVFQCLVGSTSRMTWVATRTVVAQASTSMPPRARAFAVAAYSQCWKQWAPEVFEDGFDGINLLQRCVLARATTVLAQRAIDHVERSVLPLERFMYCTQPSSYQNQASWDACQHRQRAFYFAWVAVAGALCFYFFVWPFLWSALRAFWAQNVLAPYRERQRRWQEERYRTLAMDPHWQRLHKQEYQAKQRLDAACEEQRDHHQCHRKHQTYEQMLAFSRRTCQLRAALTDAHAAWEEANLALKQYESPPPYPGLINHLSNIKWTAAITYISNSVLSWTPYQRRQMMKSKQIHDFGTDVVDSFNALIEQQTSQLMDIYGSWTWLTICCVAKRCYCSWRRPVYTDPREHLWFLQQSGPDIILQYQASKQCKRSFKMPPQAFSHSSTASTDQAPATATIAKEVSATQSKDTVRSMSRSSSRAMATTSTVSPFALCQEGSLGSMPINRSSSATPVCSSPGNNGRTASQQRSTSSAGMSSHSSGGSNSSSSNNYYGQRNLFTSWVPMPAMTPDWAGTTIKGPTSNDTCCYVSLSPRGHPPATTKGYGTVDTAKASGNIALCSSSRSSSKASGLCGSPGTSPVSYYMGAAAQGNYYLNQFGHVAAQSATTRTCVCRPTTATPQHMAYSSSSSNGSDSSSNNNACGQGSISSSGSTTVQSPAKPVSYGMPSVYNCYIASQVPNSASDDASGWFDSYSSGATLATAAPEGVVSPKVGASPAMIKDSSLEGACAALTAAQALSAAAGASTAALEQRRQQCWAMAEMV